MAAPLSSIPHRDGDDDAQADVEHDRRRDHEVRMPVGQIEEACQVEGAAQSTEYAADIVNLHPTVRVEEVELSERCSVQPKRQLKFTGPDSPFGSGFGTRFRRKGEKAAHLPSLQSPGFASQTRHGISHSLDWLAA